MVLVFHTRHDRDCPAATGYPRCRLKVVQIRTHQNPFAWRCPNFERRERDYDSERVGKYSGFRQMALAVHSNRSSVPIRGALQRGFEHSRQIFPRVILPPGKRGQWKGS
jgi:hypothetical protein